MNEEVIFKKILDCSFKVHSALGPGLLESAYEECLCYELKKSELLFERQKSLPLVYEDVKLDAGYRIDILVENKIVVEIKSVDALAVFILLKFLLTLNYRVVD
ncbi:MAG: GxxExxY protein [Melioribacteraceae bacterium]